MKGKIRQNGGKGTQETNVQKCSGPGYLGYRRNQDRKLGKSTQPHVRKGGGGEEGGKTKGQGRRINTSSNSTLGGKGQGGTSWGFLPGADEERIKGGGQKVGGPRKVEL